jgi:preprotein translocase subunit YajC
LRGAAIATTGALIPSAAAPGSCAVGAQATVGGSFVLISPAYAQAAGASTPGSEIMTFLPMIAIFVVFYFLLIRPQQKRAKETKAMLSALQKGDEVVTAGGIVGKVVKVEDDFIKLQVSNNVDLRIQKSAVGATLPKGTLKSLDEK